MNAFGSRDVDFFGLNFIYIMPYEISPCAAKMLIPNFMRILGFRKDACPSMPAGLFPADAAEVAVVFEDFVEFNKRGMIWEPGTEK